MNDRKVSIGEVTETYTNNSITFKQQESPHKLTKEKEKISIIFLLLLLVVSFFVSYIFLCIVR